MKPVNIVVRGNTLDGFGYGAAFIVGSGHMVENNRFLNVNRAHCGATPVSARCNYALAEQPELLSSGIYLAANGGREVETKGNTIRNNTVTGYGMKERCVAAAPGVELAANRIQGNNCGPE